MRCNKGDVAIVVKGIHVVNIGKIVTCLEYIGEVQGLHAKDNWLVDTNLYFSNGTVTRLEPYASDASLKPIRDSDDPDETLTDLFSKEAV